MAKAREASELKEAMLYEKQANQWVVCHLCRHRCRIPEGRLGICGVRANQEGVLYTLVYEKAIAVHVDPIEKKPLFHVYPGSRSFSIATVGCNFHCDFCQNWDISQVTSPTSKGELPHIPGQRLPVSELVDLAEQYDCKTIAYTYTEPTIFFEYAYDAAKIATQRAILNLFVTNGYLTPEALDTIQPYLDAANVDLKGFNDHFYRRVVGAKLDEVLDSLKYMKQLGIWLEVTTLIVPGYDDNEPELRDIARFIKQELGEETPWHISRFFPHYKMSHIPPTSLSILRRAREIGLEEGLRYVYSGNVPGDEGENTYCYNCGKLLIKRYGFQIVASYIEQSKCTNCGSPIDGLGMDKAKPSRMSLLEI